MRTVQHAAQIKKKVVSGLSLSLSACLTGAEGTVGQGGLEPPYRHHSHGAPLEPLHEILVQDASSRGGWRLKKCCYRLLTSWAKENSIAVQ